MKLNFTISKEKGGQWYAHRVGFSSIPCAIDGCRTFGDKKNALHNAAIMQGLPYKEYMRLRNKEGTGGGEGNYKPMPRKVK